MTKGRLLALWAGLVILGYIFASQDWFALSMAPDGKVVKLSSYDGLTAYSNLSPLLMLNFVVILAVAFVGTLGRKITLGLIALLNLATLVSTIIRVTAQDVSGLAKQVEQMTGIAAAHGVEDMSIQVQLAPMGFIGALATTTLLLVYLLVVERKWPKRSAKTEIASKATKTAEPKDAIGIWDSQRR
jgi:hypothetical protein